MRIKQCRIQLAKSAVGVAFLKNGVWRTRSRRGSIQVKAKKRRLGEKFLVA